MALLAAAASQRLQAILATTPAYCHHRPMSMFESRWKKARDKRNKIKYEGRLRPLPEDRDGEMPIYDYNSSEKPLSRVYTWGMACYGALGVPEYLRPKSKRVEPFKTMHRPARCSSAETKGVVDVACGYGFTVFALGRYKGYHIMGTGMNKSGQLGEESASKLALLLLLMMVLFCRCCYCPNVSLVAVVGMSYHCCSCHRCCYCSFCRLPSICT